MRSAQIFTEVFEILGGGVRRGVSASWKSGIKWAKKKLYLGGHVVVRQLARSKSEGQSAKPEGHLPPRFT